MERRQTEPVARHLVPAARTRELEQFEAPSFAALLGGALPAELRAVLREHIRTRRWFRGKARSIRDVELLDQLALRPGPRELVLAIVRVVYASEPPETYVLPLGFEPLPAAESSTRSGPAQDKLGLFALHQSQAGLDGVVYDPSGSDELSELLLELFVRDRTPGQHGAIEARPSKALLARVGPGKPALPSRVPSGEQSNTSVFYGDEFMLKLFRQLEAGINPDVELNQFLWARGYRNVPEPLASVSYARGDFHATLGLAQRFVTSDGSAWDVTLASLARALELARSLHPQTPSLPSENLLESSRQLPPEDMRAFVAEYGPLASLLGERTAELHLALASSVDAPAFAPEPFTADYLRSMVDATRERVTHAFDLLAKQRPGLPEALDPLAHEVQERRDALLRELAALESGTVHASRIRCHGDYHLGQVLYGSGDFMLLDFEGEPAQPIEQRRRKRSALYDVCGMLRSYHYAATVALQSARWRTEERALLAAWSDAWYRWTSAEFLRAYLTTAREQSERAVFLPHAADELDALLRLHMIDKCSYELSYELNNRPTWVGVPMAGLLSIQAG